MQCAQSLELMAKENSKLSLWRGKVFKKKTVESLRATPLALLRLLLKMSDKLVLIVCVMFKNEDFLCNDLENKLESIYVLNKLRRSQVYQFYQYLSPSLKKFFLSYLLQAFHWSTDIFWTPQQRTQFFSVLKKIYARTTILPFNVKCKFILKQYFFVTQTMDLKWLTHSCEKQDTYKHFKKINGCLQ